MKPSDSEVVGLCRKLCVVKKRLDGKLAIVTGCNCGIGEKTAAELARRGCKVIMACRSVERGEEAKTRIVGQYGMENKNWMKVDVGKRSVSESLSPVTSDKLQVEPLDLSSVESIHEFARRIQSDNNNNNICLDFLINNAGLVSPHYVETEDGYEMTMAVNHLGHFLLTQLLLPLLLRSTSSRIVVVSSAMHYSGRIGEPSILKPRSEYERMRAYADSKLANVAHAIELAERLKDTRIKVVSVHPGVVRTEITRSLTGVLNCLFIVCVRHWMLNPWQGAQTTLYAILSDQIISGGFYSNCKLKAPSDKAVDIEARKRLWNQSCELMKVPNEG